MANKETLKVPIIHDRFMTTLQEKGCSIRQLGKIREIDRDEKTIRRYVATGKMPPDLLDRIARYLDVEPDFLAGLYDAQYERMQESARNPEELRILLTDSSRYPYFKKERKSIDYKGYIKQTLTTQNISEKQFAELSADNRIKLQFEMASAVDSIIRKFFDRDANGHGMDDDRRAIEVLLMFSKDWYADPANPEETHVTMRSLLAARHDEEKGK